MKTCPSKSSSQLFEKSMMRRVGGNVLVLSAAFASLSIEHSAHNTPISPPPLRPVIAVALSHTCFMIWKCRSLTVSTCFLYAVWFTCMCLRVHVRVCVCAHTFVFARMFVFARTRSCLRAHVRVCALTIVFASIKYSHPIFISYTNKGFPCTSDVEFVHQMKIYCLYVYLLFNISCLTKRIGTIISIKVACTVSMMDRVLRAWIPPWELWWRLLTGLRKWRVNNRFLTKKKSCPNFFLKESVPNASFPLFCF